MARIGTGRVTGPNNHEGDLHPLTSPWGEAFIAAIPQMRMTVMDIGEQHHNGNMAGGPGGTVGGFTSLTASVLALFAEEGFYGDVEANMQPTVTDPPPYRRV